MNLIGNIDLSLSVHKSCTVIVVILLENYVHLCAL